MNALLAKLQKSRNFWFLLITSFAFFLMRLPSFFEPYWYGDEGIYEVLGFGMRHGRLLYQGVWDNKPPLLYLIYALFDGNQTYVRLFSFFVGLIAIYFFFALSRSLFEKQKSQFIATGVFTILLGLPLLEGNIANAENFMILPAVLAMYTAVKTVKNKQYSLFALFSAGLLLGLSFLIKVVAVFDFATLFLFVLFVQFTLNKTIKKLFIELLFASIGFFIPLLATVGFFASKGILKIFIQSAFLSNVGYVNYGNEFIIPQGFLILKLLILCILFAVIFIKRKSLSLTHIFLYLWLPFSVFNAFFSQRPYTHYMLVAIAAISLFLGFLLEKRLRLFHSAIAILVVFLFATNFWFYVKTPLYYTNFIQFLLGQKTITQYQSFFDKGVPRDYAVADFLRQSILSNKKIFLWTNSAQIYYLIHRLPLGRYTVAYHMTLSPAALKETSQVVAANDPDIIVVLPNASTIPFSLHDYRLRVSIQDAQIYERLF